MLNFLIEAQLEEIRRDKLSRIICDNSDHLDTVQVYSMVLPDPEMWVVNQFFVNYNISLFNSIKKLIQLSNFLIGDCIIQ